MQAVYFHCDNIVAVWVYRAQWSLRAKQPYFLTWLLLIASVSCLIDSELDHDCLVKVSFSDFVVRCLEACVCNVHNRQEHLAFCCYILTEERQYELHFEPLWKLFPLMPSHDAQCLAKQALNKSSMSQLHCALTVALAKPFWWVGGKGEFSLRNWFWEISLHLSLVIFLTELSASAASLDTSLLHAAWNT